MNRNNNEEEEQKRRPTTRRKKAPRPSQEGESPAGDLPPPTPRRYTYNIAADTKQEKDGQTFGAEQVSVEGVPSSSTYANSYRATPTTTSSPNPANLPRPRPYDVGSDGVGETLEDGMVASPPESDGQYQQFVYSVADEPRYPGAERVGRFGASRSIASDNGTVVVGGDENHANAAARSSLNVVAELVDEPIVAAEVGADRSEELAKQLEEERRNKKRQRCVTLSLILLVMLLAMVIAVVLSRFVFGRDDSGDIAVPTAVPTKTPTDLEDQIKTFLVSAGVSRSVIDDSSSPQGHAVSFLDLSGLSVPSSTTSDQGYKYISTFVLATIYYAMGGPSWDDDFFFTTVSDPCLWTKEKLYPGAFPVARQEGVLCVEGDVLALELPSNNLTGALPTELGLLTRLEYLGMSENEITGNIPMEIGNMSGLVTIGLGFNLLNGSIPESIGNLNNLSSLTLSNNALNGSIPESFSNLVKLRGLGLDDNALVGDFTPLKNLPNISFLYLEDNGFQQTVDDNFLSPILGTLVHLDISDNKLHGQLPTHIFESETLEVLDLHGNEFTGPLPEFPLNVKLRFLALHENGFEGPIPDMVSNLQALAHLDITSNRLTEFASSMSNMAQLEYLFLADNDFVAGPVPEMLRDLVDLRDLSLKHTQRTGQIPTWFGELDSMRYLDLDSNMLGGPVPSEIGDMSSLVFLQLQRNTLVGEIPTSFANLVSFQYLDFENNTLVGSMDFLCDIKAANAWLVADCGGDNPEVECPCCTTCCEDATSESCNDSDMLSQLDPTWETRFERSANLYTFEDFNITDENP